MDRVEEIEAAITSLPKEEYRRFVKWFHAHEEARWDEQLDRDSSSGKLDFLFAEAEDDPNQGLVPNWPPLR
jgi:hypothetical protein